MNYITADNDVVISALATFLATPPLLFDPYLSFPMPGNVHLKVCGGMKCHGLTTSYLKDPVVRSLIAQKISDLLVSLKINLIDEGVNNNIRLLANYHTYDFEGRHGSSQLIDNTNKIITSIDPTDKYGRSDSNFMHYLNAPNSKKDPFEGFLIGFTDTLQPGEYRVLGSFNPYGLSFNLYGNLKSAFVPILVDYDEDSHPTAFEWKGSISPPPNNTYIFDRLYNTYASTGVAIEEEKAYRSFPALISNNRPIKLKFTLD